ncbi:Shedu anti-phage system protein SduA domain-containing protein [Inquilinus sp. CA228]|uniref:Shedu anti-phage system protein SduA domain-containing protein n=1 Tax=Inquilinus sp. CA228 TaxID=3455609 RepID=UPI003F8D5BAC
MKSFVPLSLDPSVLNQNLTELETLLSLDASLRERDQVLPFFKARPHLCAALGLTNNAVELPDRWASELDLFGDFACDVAAGDSEANAYTLVEFEDAQELSIFSRLKAGKTMKQWSRRFERGFSQLVDWAWRLSAEGESSAAIRRIFGDDNPTIHLLLVIGRDADLTKDDLARLRWRAQHTSLGHFRMSCFTFDGLLHSIRRRLLLSAQPSNMA